MAKQSSQWRFRLLEVFFNRLLSSDLVLSRCPSHLCMVEILKITDYLPRSSLKQFIAVNGRDKLSQKWSFKSEPLWKDCGIHSRLSN